MESPVTPTVRKSLQHRTIAAATAEELRRRILDGRIAAGSQPRQDALAAEFGVSRIPIREALLQLEAEGLIKIVPHRGAVVVELSVGEIEELFDLRHLIEPWLLNQSAPRLTAQDFSELQGILDEYTQELRSHNVHRWGELNTLLHMTLYRQAARPRALSMVKMLLQDAGRHTRMQLKYTDGIERAEREHAEMVQLCKDGEISAACKLLKRHITNVKVSLVGVLRIATL